MTFSSYRAGKLSVRISIVRFEKIESSGAFLFGSFVNYIYDRENQKIYFHGVRAGHKVDTIKACDKVCFTVYGNETIKEECWAPFRQSAVVFGRCRLVEAGEEAAALLKQFALR